MNSKKGTATLWIVLAAVAAVAVIFLARMLPLRSVRDYGKAHDGTPPPPIAPPAPAPPPPGVPQGGTIVSSTPATSSPRGLFVLMFPGVGTSQYAADIEKYLLHNPTVTGADIFIRWSVVDNGPGANPRYDWSSVDADIAPWVAAGKTVNLVVWGVNYGKTNMTTPGYVLSSVDTVSCTTTENFPVVWESAYADQYKKFMSAVIGKYDANPSIGYIRFGLSTGGETYPTCTGELKQHGFTDALWKNYIFGMLDYEKSLAPKKQLMVGINSFFGNPPDYTVSDAVAGHAAATGIGFGSQGLQISDIANYAAGKPCSVNWCAMFDKYNGLVPLELQTVAVSDPGNTTGKTGSLAELIPFALERRTQIFEIYYQDWLTAYDPQYPSYAGYHDAYAKALETAAQKLGVSK